MWMFLCTCVGICVCVGQTDACIRSAWWLHAHLLVYLHARLCVITYRSVWVLLRHRLKLIPSIQFLLRKKIMSGCWSHPGFLKEHWWKQKLLLNHWSVASKYMHTQNTTNKRIGQPLWPPKIQSSKRHLKKNVITLDIFALAFSKLLLRCCNLFYLFIVCNGSVKYSCLMFKQNNYAGINVT